MNVVASVLARLRNHSKSSGAPFQQVLQQYAMERFLYRISKSKYAQSVILKGALLTDRDGNEAGITPARAAPKGRGAERRVIPPSPPLVTIPLGRRAGIG
jgi:hypothetical protein